MSDIETRLFRYFVVLADEQHFGRAAIQLDISPPTLTNQIQKLEKELGAKLVERRGNTHVELTEAGKRFLERARNVLHEASEAKAVAQQVARGETGRLEIGFMTIASLNGLIGKGIGGFRKLNPGIDLVLRAMVTMDQINAILGRTLDCGFVRPPDHYPVGLQGLLVAREPMVLALPADHPLGEKNKIAPASLRNEAFINTGPDLDISFWNPTTVLAKAGDFTPTVVRRVSDMVSILSYVSAGLGVAMVGKGFTRMDFPNVIYRDLDMANPPIRTISFVYRKNEASPAAQALIKYMRGHALAD
jgi:DNA-binding transcriptional LysR family regulator